MARKVKYDYDFKLRCVEEILKGRSAIAVAGEFKCNRSQVWKWFDAYKREGASGLMPRDNRSYDVDFKLKVLRSIEEKSLTLKEACILFKISGSSLILNWQRSFVEKGKAGLHSKTKGRPESMQSKRKKGTSVKPLTREEELLLENESLRAENALLKKLQALIQAEESKKRKP